MTNAIRRDVDALSGWGRYPRHRSRLFSVTTPQQLEVVPENFICRGNGRAYGDAAIGIDDTVSMLGLNKLLAFDTQRHLLTCEAGVLLADLIDLFVPRGWFVPVTPGTRFVTVGGMIASDVHGKNHHNAGAFSRHVEELTLYVPERGHVTCSRDMDPELFNATCGGMGLTGIIVAATIKMLRIETAFVRETTKATKDLEETLEALRATKATYSVAWIDCLAKGKAVGRAIIMDGEHAAVEELPPKLREHPLALGKRPQRSVPFDMPAIALNGYTVGLFNALYYHSHRSGTRIRGLDAYFYPLDGVANWNRMYGRRGFLQFQFVVPTDVSAQVISQVLSRVAQKKAGSFLAVLKQFGPGSDSFLSFPMEGTTLALDFPVSKENFLLLVDLHDLVSEAGGRVYLAKDAFMSRSNAERGYPHIDAFRQLRQNRGLDKVFQSLLSRRLAI